MDPPNYYDIEANTEGVPGATTWREYGTALVSCVTVFTSVAAMVAAGGSLVYVAGFLSIILSPYAVYQQKQLIDIEALEGTRDQLEEEVSKLRKTNEKLNDNVQDLEGTISRLKDVENALDILTQTQGQSVDTFKDQVEENRKILQKMGNNLKTSVLQNLLSVVILADKNSNHMVDVDEVENLLLKLKKTNGVLVNEDNLRRLVKKSGGKIDCIMEMIKEVIEKESNDGNSNAIFQFTEESSM
mmetsp:Transcript_18580/g.24129  ORF Transcript_18580/g.24129 Transcript_18580/m.24129 type:complete len:243 (-) Transcript_18580:52-780(-)